MSSYYDDPYGRSGGRSSRPPSSYSGAYSGSRYLSTEGYTESRTSGSYPRSSSRASSTRRRVNDDYDDGIEAMTSKMASVDLSASARAERQRRNNLTLFSQCERAVKKLREMEAQGYFKPFKVCYPTVVPATSSSSRDHRPASRASSHSKYHQCKYCKKEYSNKDDMYEHEERRHFPCPYCGKECEDKYHRRDHKERCSRR
ncbi:hypothetical protein PT974_05123 [Cladobotryum mycophilum]|uniref:C2H2-type domain-containing protein n=1 Tax=Cladobotryum mycophilum TaxID=491253 RepID=A0ABR0SSD4_9HYPO